MNMQHQLSSAELLFDISLRLMGAERYGNPRGGVSLFSPDENEKDPPHPSPHYVECAHDMKKSVCTVTSTSNVYPITNDVLVAMSPLLFCFSIELF
jgi:hypothetical protein